MSEPMHSGYVALIGRPNVGKSTLMNALIGAKVSIVSAKPQTTRNRISGMFTDERGQIIFVDTPGVHAGKGDLNAYMVNVAMRSLADVDVVAVLVEAAEPGPGDRNVIAQALAAGKPTVLVVNKTDKLDKDALLPVLDGFSKLGPFDEILPVSALRGEGLDELTRTFYSKLPESPPYFPEDQITEVTERFIAAETVREKAFEILREELPYSTAVEIEKFDESDAALLRIAAVIAVERDSQKGIVIGKGGRTLKEIGTRARKELEQFFDTKVFLETFVKVVPNWTKKSQQRKRFGYE